MSEPTTSPQDDVASGCVLARTLHAGASFLEWGEIICSDPEECACGTPHPGFMSIELRPVSVLRDVEVDTTSDPFGRELIKFWCRDDLTGAEGYRLFGPGGVVRTQAWPPYFILLQENEATS